MANTIVSLNLNRPKRKGQTLGGVPLQNTELVKQQLLVEIVELEKQMEALITSGDAVDFSMIQTYKEMIHSRRQFFNELNN